MTEALFLLLGVQGKTKSKMVQINLEEQRKEVVLSNMLAMVKVLCQG
jgi:hypothetical protein